MGEKGCRIGVVKVINSTKCKQYIIAIQQASWRIQYPMSQGQNNQKIFYALMLRIGANHRYQKILLFIWIFVGFTIGSTVFSPPFLFLQSHYHCSGLSSSDCNTFVCSLPTPLRLRYLKEHINSIATDYGDFLCENKGEIVKAEAFIYIGGIGGVLLGALLSSCLTKKTIFILTVVVSITGMAITLFGQNLLMATVGLHLNYACKCIQIEMIYCFITQTVDEEKRGKHQTIIFMFQALGSAMNGPIIYLLGSWKTFLLAMYVVPSVLILACLLFIVRDTIFDSIVYQTPEETLEIIERIAEVNHTSEYHNVSLEQLSLIKNNFGIRTSDEEEENMKTVSVVDLFVYKSIRNKILLIIILGLFIQFNFDGPELMITEFSMPIYLNGFILGISELFSCLVGYLMVDKFERKKMMLGSTCLAILVGLPVVLVSNCQEDCTKFQQIFQTVGLFLFRMLMSFTFTTFILTQFQLFPTQVRGIAVQVVSSTGYVAVSLVPVISKLVLKTLDISVISCFLFNCGIILVIGWFIPETYNNPAPDMIEQLSQQYDKLEEDLPECFEGEKTSEAPQFIK